MWNELFDLLDRAFADGAAIDASTVELPLADIAQNPFLSAGEGDGYRFQTMAGDLLLLFDVAVGRQRRYHMISPANSMSVVMPDDARRFVRPHRHDYLEIVIILEGELDFIVEGDRRRFRAGDCSIVNQNVLHVEGGPTRCAMAYLSLRPSFARMDASASRLEADGPLFRFLARNAKPGDAVDYLDFHPLDAAGAPPALARSLTDLTAELLDRRPGYLSIAEGLVVRILDTLQDPSHFACQSTRYYRRDSKDLVERIMAYIQSRRCHLTRDELARELNYNGNYLNDAFVKRTGITLGAYIRQVCLQEAAYLLLNTDLSVEQIARRLRYASRSSFYSQFQARYGVSPARFRACR